MKFNENPSNGNRVVPYRERPDKQTDMTKLTVAFHNIANAPIKLIAKKVTSKFHLSRISTPALDHFSISYIFRLSKVL